MKNNKPNLLEDSIGQLFIKIAIPSSIGTVFMTLYNVVDTYFAGKISPEALAALAQTFPVYFIIIAIGVGLSIGTTSLIANALGDKKIEKASYFLAQSISLAILTATIVTLIGIYLGPSIILLMNDSIATTFLMAEAKHQAIASRLVKEIARLNGDVSKFVTPGVETSLKEKFKHKV